MTLHVGLQFTARYAAARVEGVGCERDTTNL